MAKIYLKPSSRADAYPNGGDESYWMRKIASAVETALSRLGVCCVLEGDPPPDCGLCLYLCSHAAPAEMEAKIKGADVFYYKYSPAGRRAAEVFSACLKGLYPQPELVEASPTAAREDLANAKAPALLLNLCYHDNPQDEAWLVSNVDVISAGLAKTAAEFLGVDSVDG
ncbi:hypothetical protein D7X94_02475 [Acutalibacter sp. 1XD8-33]|uniref:N-acetylmuramoyl-L-alanine amidase n=1 Tax=Acutalibacter sp. 1XD8-33 TaxID=2320081 RepID=UPI000EA1480C|nr:N-acetylmuramoyl-L-alanine amidase [Acutalibacter sp. 1XD8-33]RKJ41833.1 hypothetical protein D7X94_02475 [Acutalibacter sp. 1XD8-33]